MKYDFILPIIVIGVIAPILFSPMMIQGIYPDEIEVEFEYPKNPSETELPKLIQPKQMTFTNFITQISGEEIQDEPILIPPDIPPDIEEQLESESILDNELEKRN